MLIKNHNKMKETDKIIAEKKVLEESIESAIKKFIDNVGCCDVELTTDLNFTESDSGVRKLIRNCVKANVSIGSGLKITMHN